MIEDSELTPVELNLFKRGNSGPHTSVDDIAFLARAIQFRSNLQIQGLKWDTIIEQKTNELGHLVGKCTKLNLTEPTPILARNDSQIMRDKILQITQTQSEKLGIT